MSSEAAPTTSIRRRLLLFLMGSLLLMITGAAVVTYRVAMQSANDAYDRSLLDPAFDIADNVRLDAVGAHVDLPQKALEALVYDQVDKVIFQVRSPENVIVDGVTDLPPPADVLPEQHRFFDSRYRGEKIRIAALRTPAGFVVQVGETLHKRNRLVWDILVAELVPTLLIGLGAILLTWFGVARGLVPLELLRSELLGRAPNDLRPLAATAAPLEIAPVISAFNRLLDHLRDASAMQQRFLANAAHQLRTPLAGLQMHLELLLRRELPEDVRAELQRMHGATGRASRLAIQLLALAKAESARPGLQSRTRGHPGGPIAAARTLRQPDRQCVALHPCRRNDHRAHRLPRGHALALCRRLGTWHPRGGTQQGRRTVPPGGRYARRRVGSWAGHRQGSRRPAPRGAGHRCARCARWNTRARHVSEVGRRGGTPALIGTCCPAECRCGPPAASWSKKGP